MYSLYPKCPTADYTLQELPQLETLSPCPVPRFLNLFQVPVEMHLGPSFSLTQLFHIPLNPFFPLWDLHPAYASLCKIKATKTFLCPLCAIGFGACIHKSLETKVSPPASRPSFLGAHRPRRASPDIYIQRFLTSTFTLA